MVMGRYAAIGVTAAVTSARGPVREFARPERRDPRTLGAWSVAIDGGATWVIHADSRRSNGSTDERADTPRRTIA